MANQNHLKKQGISLGNLLTHYNQLINFRNYCIVDNGIDEWNGGYKLYNFDNDTKEFIFIDVLEPFGEIFRFSQTEIYEMIFDNQIAFEKE